MDYCQHQNPEEIETMRDSRSHSSTINCNQTTIDGAGEIVYTWCEESYGFAKVGVIGHSVTDVGCANNDDPINTSG